MRLYQRDRLDVIAYMGGEHHYMFDEENLVDTLEKAPFTQVMLRGFYPTLDLKVRDFESMLHVQLSEG